MKGERCWYKKKLLDSSDNGDECDHDSEVFDAMTKMPTMSLQWHFVTSQFTIIKRNICQRDKNGEYGFNVNLILHIKQRTLRWRGEVVATEEISCHDSSDNEDEWDHDSGVHGTRERNSNNVIQVTFLWRAKVTLKCHFWWNFVFFTIIKRNISQRDKNGEYGFNVNFILHIKQRTLGWKGRGGGWRENFIAGFIR